MTRATNPNLAMRDNKIANDRVTGMTYRNLAKKYNISKTRISQILSTPEIKDVIEAGTSQIISLVPLAADIQLKTMENRKENPALALKASEIVLKTGGIIPSNVTNQTVNAVFNVQNNITLSPGVAVALANMSMQDDPDLIDEDLEE